MTREYLPLALWLGTWALLGLHLGHADAVRLLAANAFVAAARSISTLEAVQVLSNYAGTAGPIRKPSRRLAWKVDLASLASAMVLLALLVGLLLWRGMGAAALMVGLVALGLPARHPGGLLVAARDRAVTWKLSAGAVGLTVAAAVFILGGGLVEAALVLAVRDWGGLAFTALFGPKRQPLHRLPQAPLTFADFASRTEANSRRRLTYRIGKSALIALFGPFGNIVARTGRGAQLDRRIVRFVPRHRGSMAMLTAAMVAGSLALLLLSREPSALLGAAALARIAATAGSALLWWNYARDPGDEDDDED